MESSKEWLEDKHATAAATSVENKEAAAAAAGDAPDTHNNETRRLSLSAGAGRSPEPAPRNHRTKQLLSAAVVVIVIVFWELLWGRSWAEAEAPVQSMWKLPFLLRDGRLISGLFLVLFMLLWAAKIALEERLSAKARRRVVRRLEASFKLPSTVGTAWLRVRMNETAFGFGPVAVRAAAATAAAEPGAAPKVKEGEKRNHDASSAANVLTVSCHTPKPGKQGHSSDMLKYYHYMEVSKCAFVVPINL